jgi:sensor domain CHASE-containing protein
MQKRKFESLRTRTILIVSSAVLACGFVSMLVAAFILLRGFERIEKEEFASNIERIRNRIDSELQSVSSKNKDWASWDDAFAYMADRSKTFEIGNLDPKSTLQNLALDLLVYIAPDRSIVKALEWDSDASKPVEFAKDKLALVQSDKFWVQWSDEKLAKTGKAGLVTLGSDHWLWSMRPVTSTEGGGESRGQLLFGKRITKKFIQTLSEQLKYPLELYVARDPLPFRSIHSDDNVVQQMIAFRNWNNSRAFVLKASFDRSTMKQGRVTLNAMLLLLILSSVVVGGVILFQIERSVLRRVRTLKQGAVAIIKGGSTDLRLSDDGNDEIYELTHTVNAMVATIGRKTATIRDIVDHVKFGFLMMDLEGKVLPGVTRSCYSLLDLNSIEGRPISDILCLDATHRSLLEMTFEQIKEDIIPDDITFRQLPKRLRLGRRMISFEVNLIRDKEGKPDRALASLIDVTSVSEIELKNRRNETIIAILRSKDVFTSLVANLLDRKHLWIQYATTDQTDLLRMELHTLNGNLRCFELEDLVQGVSTVEDLSDIKVADIEALFETMEQWIVSNAELTGVQWHRGVDDAILQVSWGELKRVLTPSSLDNRSLEDFGSWAFEKLTAKKLKSFVPSLNRLVQSIAAQLGKTVDMTYEGLDELIPFKYYQPIMNMLPHLIRNSLDHGIESADKRKQKPVRGQIKISLRHDRLLDVMLLEVSDDGQGVDLEALTSKAVAQGVIQSHELGQMSQQEKLRLMLHPKLSTRDSVSEISGRGLGLSAIAQYVEKTYEGALSIASIQGEGTTIQLTLPLTQARTSDKLFKKPSTTPKSA